MMLSLLPDLIFYDPTPKQFKKLMEILDQHINPSKLIYDVGCGCGRLTQLLLKNHYAAIGIDRIPRENPLIKRITYADAIGFDYQKGSSIIFARPCHNNWVQEVIYKSPHSCEIFYISKEENMEMDLGEYSTAAVKLADNIGKQKECLWMLV